MSLRRVLNRLLASWYTRAHWWTTIYARWALSPVDGGDVPWSVPRVPFHRGRIALVTAAGVHLRSAPPFDMENPQGDASFREIPGDAAASDLMITHDYYDHRAADRDVNTVFPLERLRELAPLGVSVAPRHVGFMGHILGAERERLMRETAPDVARRLASDGATHVLFTPG
jgi:D-proline reductase (dithiol) PrdB